MGKAVLISIKPKWCELIAVRKKSVEVRKNRPKLETPFRCYIYQTRKKWLYKLFAALKHFAWAKTIISGKGKVIGEFTCDKIFDICIMMTNPEDFPDVPFPLTGLTDKEIIQYLGNGVAGYGWHISDLKIYDKPKPLSEFYFPPETFCEKELCGGCPSYEMPGEYGDVMFDCEWKRQVMKAPQSWCYVEEL